MLDRLDRTVQVGDVVGFKYDIEQYGVVKSIRRDWLNTRFTVETSDGMTGEKSNYDLLAEDCWVE